MTRVAHLDLDWHAAALAAKRIAQHCEDARFVAPELTDEHQRRLVAIADEMNAITAALHLRVAVLSSDQGGN